MISVIVPVYETEAFLHACVDSILNQTVQDLELLLIDDGSPDQSGAICDEYARRDSRVRVFHTKNHGLSAARNLGLREARGEFIGFVDSDDWIEPDMFEVLLKNIEASGADISVCGLWFEHDNLSEAAKDVVDGVFTGAEVISAYLRNHIKTWVWNKLYRRDLWEGIDFPAGHVYEDLATTPRLVMKAQIVVSASRCLYHYRKRQSGICASVYMGNLIDFWAGHYVRFTDLMVLPAVRQNGELVSILRQDMAIGVARTWWWFYGIPRDSRNIEHVKTVSAFARNTYPVFGDAGWKLYLRVSIFLARYVNELSFAAGYYMNILFQRFRKRRKIRDGHALNGTRRPQQL